MRYIIGLEAGPAWHVFDTVADDYVVRGESHAVASQLADSLNHTRWYTRSPMEIDEVAEAIKIAGAQ